YLSGGVPRTGSHLWTDASGNRRRAGVALPQRSCDAKNERNAAVRGRGRCISFRSPCASRLYAAAAGHRHYVYGVAGGGCRSVCELSADTGRLREKTASLMIVLARSTPLRVRKSP